MTRLTALIIFLLMLTEARARIISEQDYTQLDAYVLSSMAELNVPGAAIAVFEGNKIVHLKGFGQTKAHGEVVTSQTPFQTGSVSKSFTALAIAQLASEGQLSLDDPVVKYLPDFQTKNSTASARITIRHLVSHHSSISMVDGNRYQTLTDRGKTPFNPAFNKLRKTSMTGEAGTSFAYSNANYILLAALIEAIEDKPFEEVLEARIFTPLGMTNSYVQALSKPTASPAIGHRQWFGETREFNFIPGRIMMGAGGVTASAEDLVKYLIAVANRDPAIIPPDFADDLVSPYGEDTNGYGFGWEIRDKDGAKLIFHGGLNPGFSAKVAFTSKPVRGGLILTNLAGSLDGQLVDGAVNGLMEFPEVDAAPTTTERAQLWGSMAITGLLVLGFFISSFRLFRNTPTLGSLKTYLPSVVLIALAYSVYFLIPAMQGVPMSAVRIFYPDLGFLLTAAAAISTIWAVLRIPLIWHAPHHS